MEHKKCIIKSNAYRASGVDFRIKAFPETYQRITLIANVSGKTIQCVGDELLSYALDNCCVEDSKGTILKLKF